MIVSNEKTNLKDKIKNIPMIGWFLRWGYNLIRLNNIKHNLFLLQNKNKDLEINIKTLESRNKNLEEQLKNINIQIQKRFDEQDKIAFDLVRTQIVNQSILFHQKIDDFVNSIDLKTQSLEIVKSKNDKEFLEQFSLDFENKFRGSREATLKRYKAYLKYLPNEIKKSLDIGCGRAEWVQLLQEKEIEAYGIEQNSTMLEIAIENNVKNLKQIDAFKYLLECEENNFDLITAFHIIENISYMELINLLLQIKKVAKENATILLETSNPQNMIVATNNFYLNPTHKNPIPSEYMKFLLEYLGFYDVEIHIINPINNSNLLKEETQTAKLINHHFYQGQDYIIKAKNKK
jgi:O-antigen chain-terminating methyltransferase